MGETEVGRSLQSGLKRDQELCSLEGRRTPLSVA